MPLLTLDTVTGPHAGIEVVSRGDTKSPTSAIILLHGRGASAEHILSLLNDIPLPPHVLVLAPQAANHSWYPNRFMMPQGQNEPHLSSALMVLDALVTHLEVGYGIPKLHTILAGFSQGACLVSQYLAERTHQYKGACILSGGLIGGDDELVFEKHESSLLETPLYMGCDVEDPHIPIGRFRYTHEVLRKLGATIDYHEYDGLRHAVHPDGVRFLGQLMRLENT
jgi:predicted esterase